MKEEENTNGKSFNIKKNGKRRPEKNMEGKDAGKHR
jgi:hypothetical protein